MTKLMANVLGFWQVSDSGTVEEMIAECSESIHRTHGGDFIVVPDEVAVEIEGEDTTSPEGVPNKVFNAKGVLLLK